MKHREEELLRALDDEESSIDDENAEKITQTVKEDFFRLLPLLHSKDKKIYDKNVKFFEEKKKEGGEETTTKREKNQATIKKFTIKDMEREMVLERIDQQNTQKNDKIDIDVLPYEKQQQELKKAFLSAVDEMDDGEDDGTQDLLQPRKKTEREQKEFESDYQSWFKEKKMDSLKDGEVLVKYWQDGSLNEDEKFLRE